MIQSFHNQLDEWEEIRVKTAGFIAGTSGILSLLYSLTLITVEIMTGTQQAEFFFVTLLSTGV